MTRIRVLVVDDEPLAREGLRLRLEAHDDVEIVGSVGRAADAVAAIRRLEPDVLFLDVQMPGMSGFEVLARLEGEQLPLIVFVTAHDQHALDAFRAHAVDYLLKPLDPARLDEALAHLRRQLADRRDGEAGRRLRDLLAGVGMPRQEPLKRIALKADGRITFVDVDDIERIEAEGDYVRVHTAGGSHLVRESLRDLEQKLDPKRFLRIHRSTIVSAARIAELQPYFHGEFVLLTKSGARLKVSRTYRAALADAVGGRL